MTLTPAEVEEARRLIDDAPEHLVTRLYRMLEDKAEAMANAYEEVSFEELHAAMTSYRQLFPKKDETK